MQSGSSFVGWFHLVFLTCDVIALLFFSFLHTSVGTIVFRGLTRTPLASLSQPNVVTTFFLPFSHFKMKTYFWIINGRPRYLLIRFLARRKFRYNKARSVTKKTARSCRGRAFHFELCLIPRELYSWAARRCCCYCFAYRPSGITRCRLGSSGSVCITHGDERKMIIEFNKKVFGDWAK